MRNSLTRTVLILTILAGLAGCGQKGPLYLPADEAAEPAEGMQAPTVEEEASNTAS